MKESSENSSSCTGGDATTEVLSFKDAMEIANSKINSLLCDDPLLNNLHPEVTTEELKSYLALEHGQAISITIHRADNDSYTVVVEQTATVMDLKKAIQRHVTLRMARRKIKRKISWRYVWKTYCLGFEGQKLTEDKTVLREAGVRNGSSLSFIKKLQKR
ncbi:U11/U12 small nuclear ribonucleoprotein 25 kDa protein-like [Ornithodoros turicata]|uniref:U11/U12 small nuclear ribonucleoprotein 25 kDa protein-like n=1 Tax=Ornithodoros turicata TaxID=34597 RepID=UPI0031393E48